MLSNLIYPVLSVLTHLGEVYLTFLSVLLRTKPVVEAGVGTVWKELGPDDFVEVSWEDALLPDDENTTDVECVKEEPKVAVPLPTVAQIFGQSAVLHPAKQSPWAQLGVASQKISSKTQSKGPVVRAPNVQNRIKGY